MSRKSPGVHSHTTVSGRIVYNRKPNAFRPSDVIRISASLYDAELPDVKQFAELYAQLMSFNIIYGLRVMNPATATIDPFKLTQSIYTFVTLATDATQILETLSVILKLLDKRPTIAKLVEVNNLI